MSPMQSMETDYSVNNSNIIIVSPFSCLPEEVILKIFSYLDRSSLNSICVVNQRLYHLAGQFKFFNPRNPINSGMNLSNLPSEILLNIFSRLDRSSLGRIALVSRRFRDLAYADCLWVKEAKTCLSTNGKDSAMISRTAAPLGARDKVRVSQNWRNGVYVETKLLVQSLRYMPRLQLEKELLWVSWGNRIWAHPRHKRKPESGLIGRTTTRVLKVL